MNSELRNNSMFFRKILRNLERGAYEDRELDFESQSYEDLFMLKYMENMNIIIKDKLYLF